MSDKTGTGFPKWMIPAAVGWLACGLCRRALDALRGFRPGHAAGAPAAMRDGRETEREPMFLSQYEGRP